MYQSSTQNRPKEGVMFNGCLPESFCHPVARQLESNRALKMLKLQLIAPQQYGVIVVSHKQELIRR